MRIAHITDIHLRSHIPGHPALPVRRGRTAPELLSAALDDARRRGADMIAITGDVVDVPGYLFAPERDPAPDRAAWQRVRADYRLVRRMLDECGLAWIAVPGNHDSYRIHAEELGSGPFVRDVGGLRFVSFWDRESTGNVPRRTLTERERFDSSLLDPGPRPQVHLQHFVITPRLDDGYPHTYAEGEELQRRTSDSGRVVLSLSGHYHPGSEPATIGPTMFSVTPALVEHPHAYRIFDLALDGDRAAAVQHTQIDLAGDAPARKAVFLDRDGCVNTLPTYRHGPDAMHLLPGAAPALRLLRDHGYALVVVTNQSCVGLGYAEQATLDEVHDRMSELLADEGVTVDAVYSSPVAGDRAVSDRYNVGDPPKPSPAMIKRAAAELNLDLSRSCMIGDRSSDIAAAQAAGVRPILVRTGDGRATERSWGDAPACLVVDDLVAAAVEVVGLIA
ncbi:HAD-IIIA family hydrolase [Nonomuraea fuscirosea]|uniref:HAD-IIIA family hydrolase n=1 Tax=Nonomuraea fuscirosea TaxID=1291556 RepID=UPI002DD983BB|nr:HAD-IIIA family hydrolase [Nonomuraea fuscirosea]WSA53778.1 HAD-IIIA family hydrolase [Nonomuraea fuscirosea]